MDAKDRSKVDAIKVYLQGQGFVDVEDPPEVQVRADFRTLRAAIPSIPPSAHARFRFLSLKYGWLQSQETPADAVIWAKDRDIARRLKGDEREIDVLADGSTRSVLG